MLLYAVLLSWGQKIPRHRRRRQELARDTESAGPRSRPPRSRGARLARSGGFAAPGARGAVATPFSGFDDVVFDSDDDDDDDAMDEDAGEVSEGCTEIPAAGAALRGAMSK